MLCLAKTRDTKDHPTAATVVDMEAIRIEAKLNLAIEAMFTMDVATEAVVMEAVVTEAVVMLAVDMEAQSQEATAPDMVAREATEKVAADLILERVAIADLETRRADTVVLQRDTAVQGDIDSI